MYYHRLVARAWKVENASPGASLRASFRSTEKPEGKKKKREGKPESPSASVTLPYDLRVPSPLPQCGRVLNRWSLAAPTRHLSLSPNLFTYPFTPLHAHSLYAQ